MASGAAVIIAGLLPVDGAGHRVGRPDLLVRGADSPHRHAGLPPGRGQVAQDHRARPRPPLEAGRRSHRPSSATPRWPSRRPRPRRPARTRRSGWAAGRRDFLQLAHYHRMLQACGFAAEPALGAVIGTDGLCDEPVLAWADLDRAAGAHLLPQPSRRLAAAQRCWSATTSSTPSGWRSRRWPRSRPATRSIDPPPLVRPIVNRGVRPLPLVGALPAPARSGRRQPADRQGRPGLAGDRHPAPARDRRRSPTWPASISTSCSPGICRRSPTAVAPRPRLRTAARRARMLLDGTLVRPGDHRPDRGARRRHRDRLRHRERRDGRVYLWGFLVQPAAGRSSTTSSAGSPTWTTPRRARAGRRGASTGCAAWSRAGESGRGLPLQRLRGGHDPRPGRPRATTRCWTGPPAYAEEHFVDLLEIVKTHYFGVAGLGLKLMAQHAGFSLAGRRPRRTQLPALVRRGGARRSTRGRAAGAAAGAGVQRGRRDRHQPAQSVAASPVIAASRVPSLGSIDHRLDHLDPGRRLGQDSRTARQRRSPRA